MSEITVYFNMPEAEYHATEALSATGIKDLQVSTLHYNHSRQEPEEEEEEKYHLSVGKAYHARILEGEKAFKERFCATFDGKDCLSTIDDMKEYMSENGIDFKASWKKDNYIEALKDCEVKIYNTEKEKYLLENEGKICLSKDDIDRIEFMDNAIRTSREAAYFQKGYPEVSVFWEEGGVKMKARFDYLKVLGVSDLKTFYGARNYGAIVDSVRMIIIRERYDIQGVHYINGFNKIRSWNVILPDANEEQKLFIEKVKSKSKKPCAFSFVFIQTKGTPHIIIRPIMEFDEYGIRQSFWLSTERDIEYAKMAYEERHLAECKPVVLPMDNADFPERMRKVGDE